MNLKDNTVLITGGGSGIGLALVSAFTARGSKVIICGRNGAKLQKAEADYPQIATYSCDLARYEERLALFEWIANEFPGLNVLINNAGIQKRLRLEQKNSWESIREEITINLEAPIHLSTLFIPLLEKQENSAIINVTSGLAFVPLTDAPVYSATKAALHSFTLSLRQQLKKTPISVLEIIPPAVNTDLGGTGLHDFGVDVTEFTDSIVNQLEQGKEEASFGFASESSHASREQLEAIFKRINRQS